MKPRSKGSAARRPLSPLLTLFESAMLRLLEGRTRRWRAALEKRTKVGSKKRISSPLRRFKRGELTLDQLLQAKVERALRPVTSSLDEADLAFLRVRGRELLEEDPVLVELILHLTSSAPGRGARRDPLEEPGGT